MVRVYIGGKRVTKEELAKHEIRSEKVKRIITEAIARNKKEPA